MVSQDHENLEGQQDSRRTLNPALGISRGLLIKVSDHHKGVGGWKVSAKYSPISLHPCSSQQVFEIRLCMSLHAV